MGVTQRTIPAIEKAISILETLESQPSGLTAGELTKGLGMPRATVYRILNTLSDHGVVASGGADGARYVLGPKLIRWGARVESGRDLVEAARPVMAALSEEVGQTVKLSLRDGLEAVVVAAAQTRRDSRITAAAGARYPLHIGPSVRLLLAHAPDKVIDDLLARPLARYTPETIVEPAAFRAEIARMARDGWAIGDNEGFQGVGSVAALIDTAREPGIAVLSVVHPAPCPKEARAAMFDAVRRAADRIGGELGAPPRWPALQRPARA